MSPNRVLVACGCALAASPLLMNPWGFDQYQLPRLLLQAVVVIVGLGALALAGAPVAWPLVPLASFLGVLTLSALFSAAPGVSLLGTDSRRFGVLGWLLVAAAFALGLAFDSAERRRHLLHAVVAVSVPMAVYALFQRTGVDPFVAEPNRLARPVSTVGNAAFFGAFMAVAVVAALGLLLDAQRRRWWWAPVVLVDVAALLLTDSRGAWSGAMFGVALLLWRATRHGAWRPAALAAGVLVGVVVVMAVAVPGVTQRAASIVHVGEGTAGARFVLDGVGARAVAQRPLLGWGPDMSRAALHSHIPSDFEARYDDIRIEDRVHNELIDIAVWAGLVGLGCFLWFLVALVRNVRRRPLEPTAAVVVAAVAAYGVHLLFNFSVPEIDAVVWLLLGSLVAAARTLPPAPAGAVVPVVAIGLVALTPGAVRSVSADRGVRIGVDLEQAGRVDAALPQYLRAMQQSGDSAVYAEIAARAHLRRAQPQGAVDAARRLVADDPSDPFAWELLASSLNSVALATGDATASTESATILQRLIAESPFDGSLHLEYGNALAAQQRLADAKQEYLRASVLAPTRFDVWRNLGTLAELDGDPEAERYWSTALDLDPTDTTARAALERLKANG